MTKGIYKRESWMMTGKYLKTKKHRENLSKSNSGKILPEEQKNKMSLSKKEWYKNNRHPKGMLGKRHSIFTKNKQSLSHIGYNPTKETRKKLSKLNKGKIIKEETKLKLRLINKGKHNSPKTEFKKNDNRIKEIRAKQIFPKRDTKIEIKIQNLLNQLGITFFTHQYMKEIEHSYQCDVLIPSLNMVIECDGNYWHKYPIGNEIDHTRTKELLEKGFKVLRLWEHEIKNIKLNEFKEKIYG